MKELTLENKISYLGGYLKGFEILNSLVNDEKTYSVELLPKEINIQYTLKKYYNSKNWIFNEINTNSSKWEDILKYELEFYFSQIITDVYCTFNRKDLMSDNLHYLPDSEEKIKHVLTYYQYNIEMIISEFILLLKSIVKDAKFTKIGVDWLTNGYEKYYESYANDYMFDLGSHYIYLHFGGSD